MSGEMKVSRWRLPLVIGSVVVLAAAIAVGVGALIAHDQQPKASPAAFASGAAPSPHGDSHSRAACRLNDQLSADDLLDAAKVQAVFDEADQSKDYDVKLAAQRLYDGQKIASAEVARGGDNLRLSLASFQASTEMKTTCINLGYGD